MISIALEAGAVSFVSSCIWFIFHENFAQSAFHAY